MNNNLLKSIALVLLAVILTFIVIFEQKKQAIEAKLEILDSLNSEVNNALDSLQSDIDSIQVDWKNRTRLYDSLRLNVDAYIKELKSFE